MVSQGEGEIGASKLTGEIMEIVSKINTMAQGYTGKTASLAAVSLIVMVTVTIMNSVSTPAPSSSCRWTIFTSLSCLHHKNLERDDPRIANKHPHHHAIYLLLVLV
jgi:hypothetical protein